MHNCAPFCCPFRELVNVGSAAFAKSQGEVRIAAESFAVFRSSSSLRARLCFSSVFLELSLGST